MRRERIAGGRMGGVGGGLRKVGYGGGEGDAEEAHLARHGHRHKEPRAARAPGRARGQSSTSLDCSHCHRYKEPRAARAPVPGRATAPWTEQP
jgi:hypothetical protein